MTPADWWLLALLVTALAVVVGLLVAEWWAK